MAEINDFKPRSWGAHPLDLAKEFKEQSDSDTQMETPDKADPMNASLARRGLLNVETGALLPGSCKQRRITQGNVQGFSRRGKENYQAIFGHD